jgi:rRNA maturation endonuclease Nob1
MAWRDNLALNLLMGLILVVVAFTAGWHTYRTVHPPRQEEYTYVLKCTGCGKIYPASYPRGQEPPFQCIYCQKPAYPALKCRSCGQIFPSVESPSRKAPYTCPTCGKTAFPLNRWEIPTEQPPPIP